MPRSGRAPVAALALCLAVSGCSGGGTSRATFRSMACDDMGRALAAVLANPPNDPAIFLSDGERRALQAGDGELAGLITDYANDLRTLAASPAGDPSARTVIEPRLGGVLAQILAGCPGQVPPAATSTVPAQIGPKAPTTG